MVVAALPRWKAGTQPGDALALDPDAVEAGQRHPGAGFVHSRGEDLAGAGMVDADIFLHPRGGSPAPVSSSLPHAATPQDRMPRPLPGLTLGEFPQHATRFTH